MLGFPAVIQTCLPRRAVGRTRLQVSELGLGAASLGNLYRPMSDAEAHETLDAAFNEGIGYVDCAPYYGFGLCEQRVGEGLKGREGIVVSTKVGRLLEPAPGVVDDSERFGFRSALPFTPVFDYSYDGVMKSWESSLQRLGVARIDMLYVHDIGRMTHGYRHPERLQQLIHGGGLRALAKLRAEGQIDAVGIGVNEVQVCLELMEEADLDVILLAGRYTLLEQKALDVLFPECARRGTSVVIGGPYNSGILATGTRSDVVPRFNYEVAATDIVFRVRRLERVCREFNVPLPAAALQFPLAHPQVASVIPGLGGSEQVAQTMTYYRTRIPAEFWQELRSQNLIHEAAPLPAAQT
ncbi:oxidoreductase [Steroidobacter agaridevorans]|uniref:Oxidoreductase n=1 Tax=Steroidobacter agaridevorans TaxID=2695856 RepID=A0A829YGQ0_9GAMM|nr:aldo/keto reductase [Steroidobacter agaridevorans]GFE82665.1 oxidoreductase [Steroidobacter agaridevorans]GFE85752.1 oxidoreductase [Steroidobacter agaridevorans]